jgi:4-hydroxythreonine-4-phosphate dehydrogenase
MGDPAGIGAEIIVKAMEEILRVPSDNVYLVIGDSRWIENAKDLIGSNLKIQTIASPEEVTKVSDILWVLDLKNADPKLIGLGELSPWGGKAAYEYVEIAIELALNRRLAAIVTAPLNKEALHLGGHHYSGHTEILAKLTNSPNYAMMLIDGGLRVIHVSTHVSLREACDLVTKARVEDVIRLAHDFGKLLSIRNPVIGVSGLNPHAGEGGLFGDEEIREIAPAIESVKRDGILAEGPLPPDTAFAKARDGHYDFVVAMYHDQGHIPTKMIGYSSKGPELQTHEFSGVNVTVGLPIVRTSVDHGTAFDLAGKGVASAKSMIQAIRLSERLVVSDQKW